MVVVGACVGEFGVDRDVLGLSGAVEEADVVEFDGVAVFHAAADVLEHAFDVLRRPGSHFGQARNQPAVALEALGYVGSGRPVGSPERDV